MRIVCQKCGAAYAVEDRLISAKGVRTQCPRCRAVQLAKLGENGAEGGPSPLQAPGKPPPIVHPSAAKQPAPEAPGEPRDCQQCGRELDDPFDRVIGTCEPCRSREAPASGPIEPEESFAPEPEKPVAAAPTLPDPDDDSVRARALESRSGFAATAVGGRSSSVRSLAVIGAVLVAVVAGAALLWKKPWVDKRPVLATTHQAKEIAEVIPKWKMRYLDIEGDAAQHLAAGEESLALDTTNGYAEAEEEFQKTLVLDFDSDRAVAGYVQALALGRGARLDEATYREAVGLVIAAERRSGEEPLLLVAHANLLLSRPDANTSDARALAERAARSKDPKVKALAQMAIGQSHLSTNGLWAAEAFERALELDPSHRRGYLFRARSLKSAGEYRTAVEILEKRLALDPDQWEVAEELGTLYVQLGELKRARETFDRALSTSGGALPRLALALLAYQHEGKVSEAIVSLTEISKRERYGDQEALVALGHLAAAKRLQGELDAAVSYANQALAIADDTHAHLQLLLVALQRGNVAHARVHLPGIFGRLGDPALELLLEARCLLAEGQLEKAMDAFARSAELDPRRTDALLMAGAAAGRLKSEKAFEFVLQRAAKADPTRAGPRQQMARYYLQAVDTLGGASGHFTALARDGEDPNPPMCEGLVQWHLGNHAAAERNFQRVTQIDPSNAAAHAYRALAALRRGDAAQALSLSFRAVEEDRQSALTHYAHGMALLAAGKSESAKKAFKDAHGRDPGLFAARVQLGALELATDQPAGKKLLAAVLDRDPTYFEAMRALYKSGQ
ncbi:MAG: zinc-ribbon domain-containing protein [Myxococcales bacterium]|nr:zinc-ribbon domain-containing protein [Myxococcales bacterium]